MKRFLLICCLTLVGFTSAQARETGPMPREVKDKYEIPYKLTDTNHILVRVKMNGKGPFNFIIDTGAPAFIMTEALAKKVDAKEKDGRVTFEKVELEGGMVVPDAWGIAVDMFQLKGMNSMGLAGVELHGVIGYNVLARYKITYDFTDDKLLFEPVNYKVAEPKRITAKDKDQGSLESMGDMMKFLAAMSGSKPNFDLRPRGFVGVELDQKGDQVLVKSIVKGSPAEKAGLEVGDVISSFQVKNIKKASEWLDAISKLPEGATLKFKVTRKGAEKDITIQLGKGL